MQSRRVRVLSDDVANRIAAGEVVERPASVVKELVENAVDAGASRVVVEVENAGRSRIRVVDDGEGMGREDALLALERHATSKIKAAIDLHHLTTLGFRGEALPSIASVSKFSLRTRPADAAQATVLTVEGGKLLGVETAAAARGTEVEVAELFHNVPARRKFLKSDATELRNCVDTVTVMALVHYDVGFELSTESRTLLAVPPGQSLEERVADLVGAEVSSGLYWHRREGDGAEVVFCFSAPHEGRGQRKGLRFFVNGRPVQDRLLLGAALEGYRGLLESKRYPVALLWLQVPAEEVDVNVHPAKREVRFRDERSVFRLVASVVGEALAGAPWLKEERRPEIREALGSSPPSGASDRNGDGGGLAGRVHEALGRYAAKRGGRTGDAGALPLNYRSGPGFERGGRVSPGRTLGSRSPGETPPSGASARISAGDGTSASRDEQKEGLEEEWGELRPLGAFDATYLLFEDLSTRELVLIDQHAAHERILYEELQNARESREVVGQPLLLPVVLECSPSELTALEECRDLLRNLGFVVESFGPSSVSVTTAPSAFDAGAVEGLVRDLLSDEDVYCEASKRRDLQEKSVRRAACAAAVKARKALDPSEVHQLLEKLASLRNPSHCPHGRPLLVRLHRDEVASLFHRP